MDLSKRLQTIISLVEPGEMIADIGTDHGYVPIALVRRGICRKGLAMDVGNGRWNVPESIFMHIPWRM